MHEGGVRRLSNPERRVSVPIDSELARLGEARLDKQAELSPQGPGALNLQAQYDLEVSESKVVDQLDEIEPLRTA